jgi:molybdopterin synthase sulfur carrier subunit
MLTVSLTGSLRSAADGRESVEIDAQTIRELLRKLVERYPRLQSHLDEGIAVSVNGEIYRDNRDLTFPDSAEIFLLPRIQGG